MLAKLLQKRMCFGQVFTIGTFALKEVRNSIQPKAIYPHSAPVIQYFEHFFLHLQAIIVQVGLVMEKAMPVILLCYGIPCPVASFKILEDDTYVFICGWIIGPYIILPFRRAFGCAPRTLEPWVLIGSMINY